MQFSKNQDQYYVTLDKDEYINESLLEISKSKNIQSGWINGIGAAENITLGAYPLKLRDYIKKKFEGEFELTSLMGNISTKNGNPFVHIHASISDEACNAYGGHLFSGTITATAELVILSSDSAVNRKESSEIGLYLWDLNENN